ncbi:hypothetical protein KBB96_13010 [Luteolibacter ambystomatis]|uniref:Uncharacterized protein n=1 Tax=Luteolibacter ambystomatis TaxID=2824561 RepID=A0A975G5P0_9BACT|nr:hypothetical protein [Luteolibacter ambystomatis]QUE49789.1 hypothetical protein KBB96_13010 [Luteolibacter ambystomatis]
MSEEPQSNDSAAEAPKKTRRAAAPGPRKTAKKAARKVAAPAAAVSEASVPAPAPVVAPEPRPEPVEREERPVISEVRSVARDPRLDDISGHESHDQGGAKSGWPEPETIQGGSEGSGSSGKRKRRRKKKGGQGGGQSPQGGHVSHEHQAPRPQPQPVAPAGDSSSHQRPQPSPQPQAPRVPVDPEELAKKAWRIFLGEVGEEGLALIGDQDAREISRRSFRLAEIFLEEQGRRAR